MFLFLFSNKMVIWAGIHKMLVRTAAANSEDPDQSASLKQSDLGLHCLFTDL